MAREENDGEPVDDLALMKRAYTNKKTGQIDDGLVREVVSLVQTQLQDEVSQLQTEDDASTASTNLSRFRINEIVESGHRSSEFSDENSEEHFVGTSEALPRYIPRSFPTNRWSSEFPRKFVFSEFRRKILRDFRGVISEDLFRRYVVGITLFRRLTDDCFPQYVAVFLQCCRFLIYLRMILLLTENDH
uniref:Uncharacterized protein n=1 Tax=Brassica oleracea var. oleracea TaxID=109376 RepID=A0A0D3E7D1_BRAOL